MDTIQIIGIPLFCRLGVSDEERAVSQQVLVDVELYLDLRPAGATDDLTQTIDYERVCVAAEEVAKKQPYHLIEALAEAMAEAILGSFAVRRTMVRVKKPSALAHRNVSYAAVEIVREKHA